MTLLQVDVLAVGLLGPGLDDWATGAPLLRAPGQWLHAATRLPAPQRLPATERRRAGAVVKASIVVADQAVAAAGLDPAALATVFTSSTGEPANCHALCEALAAPERLVSPTRFTNSVHNAPGGYWHIAAQSQAASTSLSAFDASFGAGLLEACAQAVASQCPVLLVSADVPYPEPLNALRAVSDVFAVALLLAPGRQLAVSVQPEMAATPCGHAGLEGMRLGIPTARALPLLQALAGAAPGAGLGRVCIEGLPGMSLQVKLA